MAVKSALEGRKTNGSTVQEIWERNILLPHVIAACGFCMTFERGRVLWKGGRLKNGSLGHNTEENSWGGKSAMAA